MSARKYLDEVQARADSATQGPWRADLHHYGDDHMNGAAATVDAPHGRVASADYETGAGLLDADATFIAAARTDVPKLAAMLRIAIEALEHYYEREYHSEVWPDGQIQSTATDALDEIDRRAEER